MKNECYPNIPWTDYANTVSPVMSLVNQNKIDDTNIGLPGYSLEWTAAYHFDATKFGIWLRDTMCLPHAPRFTHIKATVEDINIVKGILIHPNQKPITAINLASPKPIPSFFLIFL